MLIYIVERYIAYEDTTLLYGGNKLHLAMNYARGAANSLNGDLMIEAHPTHDKQRRINTFWSKSDGVSYVVREFYITMG